MLLSNPVHQGIEHRFAVCIVAFLFFVQIKFGTACSVIQKCVAAEALNLWVIKPGSETICNSGLHKGSSRDIQ